MNNALVNNNELIPGGAARRSDERMDVSEH